MAALSDRLAYVVLNMVSGVGPARIDHLVDAFGSAAAALDKPASLLAQVPTVGKSLADKIASWKDHCDLDGELALAERSGVEIITRVDEKYPDPLRHISNGPLCLYVRGKIPEDIGDRGLAVVGTRRMTRYGRDMTRHLTESAVMSKWVIVSGLALGVDAVAHESAIVMGGITIGVIGCGLGRIYPQEHTALARQAVESGGAVISENPMMMPPSQRTFPMRNRIVAALCRGVLVVEAGLNSGALITANLAVEYGKTVFAVPGQVDNPQSRGCHALIKQGARLTESFSDIAEEFSFLPGFELSGSKVCEDLAPYGDETDLPQSFTNFEDLIISALRKKEMSLEQLGAVTEIAPGILMGLIMQLELKRKVKMSQKGLYAIVS